MTNIEEHVPVNPDCEELDPHGRECGKPAAGYYVVQWHGLWPAPFSWCARHRTRLRDELMGDGFAILAAHQVAQDEAA